MTDDIDFNPAKLAWTGLNKKEIDAVLTADFNPLMKRNEIELEHPGLRELYLMSQCPEYIYFACKTLLNLDITPMQACILHSLWTHPFPMLIGSRGLSKSFSLAVYSLLRAALIQGTKIVCVGAAFRQSKVLYNYAQSIFNNAPVLQSIFKNDKDGSRNQHDMITFTLGKSQIIYIPLGTGEKIRGLRGNIILADEMNSLNTDVYEIVVNNFAAVSMNPVETMKRKAEANYLKEMGLELPEELEEAGFTNQSVIAGTMGFEFEPMYRYWRRYKDIIDSKGGSLDNMFDGAGSDLNYKDFCIMRLPYELIPKGFMDDKTISRAKATIHTGAYNSEYGCVPVKDTTGFFRRSVIEQCVAHDNSVAQEDWPNWCPTSFDAVTSGRKDCQYVMGIDPASEEDNFAIVVLEVRPDHQRVVYCWTTNRKTVKEKDPTASYYSYCARHIRYLMKRFSISKIGIDAQGGGRALSEALHDEDLLQAGERPLWPEIDRKRPQDTDKMAGDHILNMIQFANANWLSKANHELLKDLEDRTILFPRYDAVILGLAESEPDKGPELVDCILDIEEIKNELSTIVMTKTSTRERFDTPQIKTGTNKVGRMTKDRYSALLIANYLAREINRYMEPDHTYKGNVGRVGDIKLPRSHRPDYYGNTELIKKMGSAKYRVINRH